MRAALVALTCASCTQGVTALGDPDPAALQEALRFCDAENEAITARFIRCHGGTAETWGRYRDDSCARSARDVRLSFDAAEGEGCLAALRDTSCEESVAACSTVFHPVAPRGEGEPCAGAYCAEGLECDRSPWITGRCTFTCVRVPRTEPGEACDPAQGCSLAHALFCDAATRTCAPLRTPGEPCDVEAAAVQCAGAADCRAPGVCVARPPLAKLGEPCGPGAECDAWGTCEDGSCVLRARDIGESLSSCP